MGAHFHGTTSVLDYAMPWADWLAGDDIATSVWTIAPELEEGTLLERDDIDADGTTARVWVRPLEEWKVYTLTNTVTTAAGRTESRSHRLIGRAVQMAP